MFENSESFEFTSINEISGRCEDIRLLSPPIIDYSQPNSLSSAKQIFQQYGFLVVKNFLAELALRPFLVKLREEVQQLGYAASDGRLLSKESVCLSGYSPITDCKQYQIVAETIAESKLFGELFGQAQCQPLETKYLTGLGLKEYVPLHCDFYRLRGRSEPVFTTWLPLTDLDINTGTLVAGRKYQVQMARRFRGPSQRALIIPSSTTPSCGPAIWSFLTPTSPTGPSGGTIRALSACTPILNGLLINPCFNFRFNETLNYFPRYQRTSSLLATFQSNFLRKALSSKAVFFEYPIQIIIQTLVLNGQQV